MCCLVSPHSLVIHDLLCRICNVAGFTGLPTRVGLCARISACRFREPLCPPAASLAAELEMSSRAYKAAPGKDQRQCRNLHCRIDEPASRQRRLADPVSRFRAGQALRFLVAPTPAPSLPIHSMIARFIVKSIPEIRLPSSSTFLRRRLSGTPLTLRRLRPRRHRHGHRHQDSPTISRSACRPLKAVYGFTGSPT